MGHFIAGIDVAMSLRLAFVLALNQKVQCVLEMTFLILKYDNKLKVS